MTTAHAPDRQAQAPHGTVFLDRSARIKLFTPRVRDVFNLIPADCGRPLSDINSVLVNADLGGVV